jgi:hypothetical protein
VWATRASAALHSDWFNTHDKQTVEKDLRLMQGSCTGEMIPGRVPMLNCLFGIADGSLLILIRHVKMLTGIGPMLFRNVVLAYLLVTYGVGLRGCPCLLGDVGVPLVGITIPDGGNFVLFCLSPSSHLITCLVLKLVIVSGCWVDGQNGPDEGHE